MPKLGIRDVWPSSSDFRGFKFSLRVGTCCRSSKPNKLYPVRHVVHRSSAFAGVPSHDSRRQILNGVFQNAKTACLLELVPEM